MIPKNPIIAKKRYQKSRQLWDMRADKIRSLWPTDMILESLRCKRSTPTWTSKLELLYLSRQKNENFRFWWVRGILYKLKNGTNQIQNEFPRKILEPVLKYNFTKFSVAVFIPTKNICFSCCKRWSKTSKMHEANYWDKRSFKLCFLHNCTAFISVSAVFVLWSRCRRSRPKIVSSLLRFLERNF